MAGNVWEWVNDWYADNYYANSPSENPQGPTSGQSRVLRGGSWDNAAGYARSANRGAGEPGNRYYFGFGFRCSLSP